MSRFNFIICSFLIFLTLVIGTTQLKAQDGLIAHWTFDDVKDGKVKDISPNGHHATLEGKTKWIAKGAIGGALEFAGNGDYLQTPILDELKRPKISPYRLGSRQMILQKMSIILYGLAKVVKMGGAVGLNFIFPSGTLGTRINYHFILAQVEKVADRKLIL